MAAPRWHGVVRRLRRAVLAAEGQGPTDGQLLEAYRLRRDEAAFEGLVRRHGPMVWGVCRRLLDRSQDAEDAFQATFLVFIRKSSTIKPAHMVGNWLHGVAYRTAMNARAANTRRRMREKELSRADAVAAGRPQSLQFLLDGELDCLPDKYRAVLVLCDLEGKTRKEAARHLGCPEGTVAGRLARARRLLARRLTRPGLALSAGALVMELARTAAPASVPGPLITATLKTSALFALGQSAVGIPANIIALTKGVLKTMLLSRLKLAAILLAVVLAGLAATTGGLLPQRTAAAQERNGLPVLKPNEQPERDPPANVSTASDPALQGTWSLVKVVRDGKHLTLKPGSTRLVVTNRFMVWQEPDDEQAYSYKVDLKSSPKSIDLVSLAPGEKGKTRLGRYSTGPGGPYSYSGAADENSLVINLRESAGARPADTASRSGSESAYFFRREPAILVDRSSSLENVEGDSIYTIEQRTFTVPIEATPDVWERVKELQLYFSTDRGQRWETFPPMKPDKQVPFRADRVGVYWLKVKLLLRDEKSVWTPVMKVLVRQTRQSPQASQNGRGESKAAAEPPPEVPPPGLAVKPNALVLFSPVPKGVTATQTREIEYYGPVNWSITEVVKPDNAPLRVALEELHRSSQVFNLKYWTVRYRCHITLNTDAPAGDFSAKVILKTNDPHNPTLFLKVFGTVQGKKVSEPPVAVSEPPVAEDSAAPWANKLFQAMNQKMSHDFGRVAAGSELKVRFSLKNVYKVPLEITEVRVSAGCVQATPTKKRLEPNEVGAIDVVLDSRRFRGKKTVSIYVPFGEDYVSTAVLKVSADCQGDLPTRIDSIDLRDKSRVLATVNGKAVRAEEVYAAVWLSIPTALKTSAPSYYSEPDWKNVLDKLIKSEVVVQAELAKLGPDSTTMKKLAESVVRDFDRLWVRTALTHGGFKTQEELAAFLKSKGTSLEALRDEWGRLHLATEFLRSRTSPAAARRAELDRILADLERQAVIEYMRE
jgi:RNA polymerase sigma factor (sigma-70 family)